jgi:hypothetical protein
VVAASNMDRYQASTVANLAINIKVEEGLVEQED